MNDSSPPLNDDQVDELLSADLDGEFDAAARDLGLEPAAARERLDATPGVAARRDAMAGARDLLSEVPEYDELVAARLRAKAKTEGERANAHERVQHRSRWLPAVGAVAAAIVLVVGIGYAVNQNNGSSSSKSASSGSAAIPTAPTSGGAQTETISPLQNFGTAPNAESLAKQAVRADLGHAAPAAADSTAKNADSTGLSLYSGAGATSAQRAGAPSCFAKAPALAGVTRTPTRSGTASIAGKPVYVAVFSEAKADEVVIMTTDCKRVLQQTSPRP